DADTQAIANHLVEFFKKEVREDRLTDKLIAISCAA
ncbi:acetyl-CoA hydrolase, partial [Pseudomonas syringae pv. pisi str. 1704B]